MKQRGFTLIELLVALAIFSIMAVSLGAAFHNGLSAWEKGRKSADLNQEARAVLEQMARELRNAVPVPGESFKAEGAEISFYTVRDFQVQDAEAWNAQEIVRLTYRLAPEGEASHFLERVQSSVPDDGKEDKNLRLTTFPTEIAFEFAYPPDKTGGVRWGKEWDSTGLLPAGIRVRLTLYEDPGPSSPVTFTKTIPLPIGVLTPWKG